MKETEYYLPKGDSQLKKRILGSFLLLVCILGLGVTVFADGAKTFSVTSNSTNVKFYGRVAYEDVYGAMDIITTYAHLSGSDKDMYTADNPCHMYIYKIDYKGRKTGTVVNYWYTNFYYGHELDTKVYRWEVDGVWVDYDIDTTNKKFFVVH